MSRFQIYENDEDEDIVKQRFALELNTLPKYVEIEDLNGKLSMYMDLILDEDEVKDMWVEAGELPLGEVDEEYEIPNIVNSAMLLGVPGFESSQIQEVYEDNYREKLDIWNRRDEYIQRHIDEVEEFRRTSTVELEELEYDKFKPTNNMLSFELTPKRSLYRLLDDIALNENAVLARCGEYYKLHKNLKVVKEGLLKRFEDGVLNVYFMSDDTELVLKVEEGLKCHVLLSFNDEKKILRDVKKIIGDTYNITNMSSDVVAGVAYYNNKLVDKYIFMDMVLLDSVFYNNLYLSEVEVLSKKQKTVRVYMNTPNGKVSASISSNIVDADAIKEEESLREVSTYVKLRVNSPTNEELVKFLVLFGKLLNEYEKRKNVVTQAYIEYGAIIEEVVVSEREVGDVDVFTGKHLTKEITAKHPELKERLQNYSKRCQSIRKPALIRNLELGGQSGIIEDESSLDRIRAIIGNEYTINRVLGWPEEDPMYFTCLNEKSPWINLNVHSLPCCETKQNPLRVKKVEKKVEDFDKVIKITKFLKTGKTGLLPPSLNLLFNNLDIKNRYMRMGVTSNSKSTDSFLSCLNQATNKHIQRNKLNKLNVTKQSMYEYDLEEIKRLTRDENVNLTPSRYVALLSRVFKKDIYVFRRDKGETELIVPHHEGVYYDMDSGYEESVLVYEHSGLKKAPSDLLQCELVYREEGKSKRFVFSNDDDIIKSIRELYNKLKLGYSFNKKVPDEYKLELPDDVLITSQHIDSYGKCRGINVHDQTTKKRYTIITEPIAPYSVEREDVMRFIKISDLNEIRDKLDMKVVKIITKKCKENIQEVRGVVGNVLCTLLVADNVSVAKTGVSGFSLKSIYSSYQSDLREFNEKRLLSVYISQYVLYYFSVLYGEQSDLEPFVDEFFEKYFKVDSKFKYNVSKVVNSIDLDNNACMKKIKMKYTNKKTKKVNHKEVNKIIVNSKELLLRLKYYLQINILRNKKMVREYKNQEWINDYYKYVNSFKYKPMEIIFKTNDLITTLYNTKPYKISTNIESGLDTYFYLRNDKVYLAQRAPTLYNAYKVAVTWNNEKYNIGQLEETDNRFVERPFLLYTDDSVLWFNKDSEEMPVEKILGKLVGNNMEYWSMFSIN